MSIMFFKVQPVSRARGENAVARAAYVSRNKLLNHQTGKTHDYRHVPGLTHSEIVLPSNLEATSAPWLRQRGQLWNIAEAAETRRDARVAREYTVAIPHELSAEARLTLARGLAQHIANRHRVAVDLAVHGPGRGDPRNHHVHLLATTREIHENGFGRKAPMEYPNGRRKSLGLAPTTAELRALRQDWAERANDKLRDAGIEARLDARSRQAIERDRTQPGGLAQEDGPLNGTEKKIQPAQYAVGKWEDYRLARTAEAPGPPRLPREKSRDLDYSLGL